MSDALAPSRRPSGGLDIGFELGDLVLELVLLLDEHQRQVVLVGLDGDVQVCVDLRQLLRLRRELLELFAPADDRRRRLLELRVLLDHRVDRVLVGDLGLFLSMSEIQRLRKPRQRFDSRPKKPCAIPVPSFARPTLQASKFPYSGCPPKTSARAYQRLPPTGRLAADDLWSEWPAMAAPRPTYTPEEAAEILKRALKQQSMKDQGLSHDELVEMAAEVGIDRGALETAPRTCSSAGRAS